MGNSNSSVSTPVDSVGVGVGVGVVGGDDDNRDRDLPSSPGTKGTVYGHDDDDDENAATREQGGVTSTWTVDTEDSRTKNTNPTSYKSYNREDLEGSSKFFDAVNDYEEGAPTPRANNNTNQFQENNNNKSKNVNHSWTPAGANYPDDDETYPFLNSIVTMRKVKGYVNDENLIPNTTYSFLISTTFGNITNLVNLAVFLLQFGSYAAVTASIFDTSNPQNPANFPANVHSTVRASQLLSLVYSILVQDGIVKTLFTFRNGYDENALRQCFPECATGSRELKCRWYLGLSFIFAMGCYAQFLTFIMIMQAENVLGVLLNYAAVSFISTIDDRMFYLGKRGWLGEKVERHVRLVALADNVDPEPPLLYIKLAHSIAMCFLFGVLILLWILVVGRQTSGAFLSRTILVDFTDLVNPQLGTFSGFYDRIVEETRIFTTSHSVYSERKSNKAFFGYCAEIDAWTFAYNVTEFDACEWAAKSSETQKFDVVTTSSSQWFAKREDNGRIVPMDVVAIRGWSCLVDTDLCGKHGKCNGDDGSCECEEGYYGKKCDYTYPCKYLQTDERNGGVHAMDREWSSKYEILRFGNNIASVYDRPIYITRRDDIDRPLLNGGRDIEYDILFYTGRRWALGLLRSFYDPEVDGESFESYLETFHAHLSTYEVAFLSEPVDPINENSSPIGLKWFFAEPKINKNGIQVASQQQAPAVFVCTECDAKKNPCFFDGICDEQTNTCQCSEGSQGGLCEVPPVGNGHCDPYFNKIEFSMDGGDCCRATCKSSEESICGKDPTGFLDTGFFFCEIEDPIPSEPIKGKPFSEAGGKIALSDNGFVMAAEMEDGQIAIFDQLGSRWEKRYDLSSTRRCPIQSMAMASGPFASNPIFVPPVVVVITCKDDTSLQSYYCTDTECSSDDLEIPPEAEVGLFGDSVGISSDGGVIAVSSLGDPSITEGGYVDILRAERGVGGSVVWKRNNEMILLYKHGIEEDFPTSSPSNSPLATALSAAPSPGPTGLEDGFGLYEAENATLVNAEIENKFSPFSGDGYVNMLGQNSSLEWNVNDTDAGNYEIFVSYTAVPNSSTSFLVDGVEVATFDFEETATLSSWTMERKFVELNAGNHTLMIHGKESNGPNIDFLAFRPALLTGAPTLTSMPSIGPTSEPTSVPSSSPTDSPNQLVLAMSLAGSGEALALVAGDIVDKFHTRVYVYRFNGTEWFQQGDVIPAIACSSEITRESMVRLSHDGNTLLVNTGNSINIFDWDVTSGEWLRRGGEVLRHAEDLLPPTQDDLPCFVDTVALSPDGNVIGINIFNPNEESSSEQSIVTFSWTNSDPESQPKWERREQQVLEGSSTGPLSISNGGDALAVGLPLTSADLSGTIQTYEYPQITCGRNFTAFRFTFTIVPTITRWSLEFNNSEENMRGGPYFFPNFPGANVTSKTHHDLATVVEDVCVPDLRCGANFTVYPTNFGGFNVLEDGVTTFVQESVDAPVSYIIGCD